MVDVQAAPQMAEASPDGYKVTELGLLPREWAVTSLGQLADGGVLTIQNGFAEGGHNSAGNGVPHLRPFNVTTSGGIDLTQTKYVPRADPDSVHWVRKGDVIFNNTNSEELVGKTAYLTLDGEFLLSNHMTLIRVTPTSPLDAYWLANMLQHCYQTRVMHSASRRYVNQAAVTLTRLKGIKIPLPPLPEQRAIAHVLRTVQRAREATDKVIAATRELKKSLMGHLFTYGPVPVDQVDQVRLKETEIGPAPEHWKVVKLGELATVSTGTTPSTQRPDYYVGTIGFVRTSEIVNNKIEGPSTYVSEQAVRDYGLKIYQPGAVFMAMYGQGKTRGQVALLGCPAATSQNTAAISPTPEIDSTYLWLYLMSQYERLRSSGIQGHISHLNLGYVKQLLIPMPPLAEQREIVADLLGATARQDADEKRGQALDSCFNTLLSHLMTGKVRVQDLGVPAFAGVM